MAASAAGNIDTTGWKPADVAHLARNRAISQVEEMELPNEIQVRYSTRGSRCAGQIDGLSRGLCNRNCTSPRQSYSADYCERVCGLRPPLDVGVLPPVALLYLHLQKTGGTSVGEWLARQAHATPLGLQPRLSLFWSSINAGCFLSLHRDLLRLPRSLTSEMNAASLAALRVRWQTTRVAVEFHAASSDGFLLHVLPALPALAARYAALDGALLVATTVREPLSHIFSAFNFKGPWRPDAPDPSSPFVEWALHGGGASGLQVGGFVTAVNERGVRRQALQWRGWNESYWNAAGCSTATLAAARAVLARFDFASPTQCLPQLFAAIEQRLLLPPEQPHERALRGASASLHPPEEHPSGTGPRPSAQRAERVWPALDAVVREQLLRELRACDGVLWADVQRRAPADLGPDCAASYPVGAPAPPGPSRAPPLPLSHSLLSTSSSTRTTQHRSAQGGARHIRPGTSHA